MRRNTAGPCCPSTSISPTLMPECSSNMETMTHYASHPFVRNSTLTCWNAWVGEQGPLPYLLIVPSVWLVGFWDKVSHSQDWSRTPIPLIFTSQVLEVQEYATMPSFSHPLHLGDSFILQDSAQWVTCPEMVLFGDPPGCSPPAILTLVNSTSL